MKNKTFRSIRVKLVSLLILSAVIALSLSSVAMFYHTYNKLKIQSQISISNITEILAKNLSAPIEFDDNLNAELLLKTLEINLDIDGAFVLKTKSNIFASFIKDGISEQKLQQKIDNLYKLNDIKKYVKLININNIIVSTPIYLEDEYIATFCVIANTQSLQENIKEQLLVALIVSIISLIIVTLLALKLQSIFTRPIIILKDTMEDVTKNNNYQLHINNNSNDEFGILFNGFNNMVDKIQSQTKDLKKQLRMVKIAERKQNELIQKVEVQKKFVQTLIDSQEQLIITTDGKELKSANETFLDFFAINSVDDFLDEYDAACVCEMFNVDAPDGYLQKMMENESWINYVVSRSFGETHKVMISMGSKDFIFSVTGAKLPGDDNLKSAVFTNITEMENAKQEIEEIHKHTKESIEYAGLIQSTLIPDNNKFRKYFKEYFAIWHPKDTVGGDIYLFEELRDDDECLLMVIDCTGHGVPGAFVTMLVKAIERQIVSQIKHSDEVVSPANLLSVFNRSMKHLLKQEDSSSVSNAGFDGQIMYYNKKEKIIRVASARNEIFYYQDDILHVIKGDRHSVGYKDSDIDYKFTDHTIDTTKETTIYLSTDGYWDQNGGPKNLPYGKKRLKKMLNELFMESMADQQEEFLYTFDEYRDEHEVNDDVTVIGIKI